MSQGEIMACKFDRNEFKIVELDIIRGLDGITSMTTIVAPTREEAIKKYYENFPGAGNHLLIVPEECASIHVKGVKSRIVKK